MRNTVSSAAVALLLALAGCGGSEIPPPKHAAAPPPAATPKPEPLPSNQLRRSAVREAVRAGVGAFLTHVELEDRAVFVGGKFHGFRIAALRDSEFWRGVDLAPGDVVTRVNGLVVEKPDDAVQALESLEVASELRVDYERDGAERSLRFLIVEDEATAPRRR